MAFRKKDANMQEKIHLCTVICYGGSLFKTGINILQISLTNHVYRHRCNLYFKEIHEKANFNIRNDCTKIMLKIKEQLYKSQKWGLYIILLRSL